MRCRVLTLAAAIAASAALIWVQPATAQGGGCPYQWPSLRAQLESRFGEIVDALGVINEGSVLVITSSPETRSWTAIVVAPNGCAMPLAAGQNWAEFAPEPQQEIH